MGASSKIRVNDTVKVFDNPHYGFVYTEGKVLSLNNESRLVTIQVTRRVIEGYSYFFTEADKKILTASISECYPLSNY